MPDTRFFPGYIWVSTEADCRRGLCVAGNDERAAASRLVNRAYYNRGRMFTLYTMRDATSAPVRHDITVE